ncbi:FtsX-like permease family protein [Cellulomonas phragmiteti]|nr:FtsX-like permease family protein [Cellulomonas phragmiteti]
MRLVVRRAATQLPLLAAVLAVVVLGAVLLGTCALLLTSGQSQALDVALQRAAPRDVAVEVTLRVGGADARAVVDDATRVVADALAPVRPVVSTWLTSAVRPLVVEGTSGAHGYVVEGDDLTAHAELVAGRWPRPTSAGPVEVAVPVEVARGLGLAPGSELVLDERRDGTAPASATGAAAARLTVVGTFTPTVDDSSSWDRDLLRGAGSDATWELPTAGAPATVTAYGPFVAAARTLTTSAVQADRVSLVARPQLAGLGAADQVAVGRAVTDLRADLRAVLGDEVSPLRVRTELARTIAAARTQARVTTSAIVAVALLLTALAAAALALAGRLVAVRRDAELRLLDARGAARSQLLGLAAAESLVLALVAAGVAVPLASALFRWLTRLPPVADAGLTSSVGVTPTLVATVVVGALALAVVLVVPAVRPADHRHAGPRSRRGRVARTSVELLLVALATVGCLQLRGRPFAADGGADPVLVAVPVLCLVAGAAVALRVVPWVARGAERSAHRSRRLVVPLASWEVARRGHSTGAALLLVLAAAAATFGTSLGDTWSASAQDQADAQVGTELAVGLTAGQPLRQARALTALTGAEVHPVTDREVSLGAAGDVGSATSGTRLVALDTTREATTPRRPLPGGTTWADLTSGLAPATRVAGIGLARGSDEVVLTITGTLGDVGRRPAPDLSVRPTVVVQTAGGGRQSLHGPAVPLDGTGHEVALPLPSGTADEAAGGMQVVAVDLRVRLGSGDDYLLLPTESTPLDVTVTVAPADVPAAPDGGWSAVVAPDSAERLRAPGDVALRRTVDGVTVTARVGLVVAALVTGDGGLVLAGFAPPGDLPVLLSGELAAAVAAAPGDALRLQVGPTTLVARVAAVAPARAAVPRGASILADHDALSRATVAHGSTADVVDTWWVVGAADVPATAAAITAAGLGDPVTRDAVAARLRDDPLRIGVQVALWLLVAAAGVLAVAGTVVQTTAALEARTVDVARLQGMGVPRRTVVATLLVEHAAVSVLVVAAGGVVGAVAALTVGPLLVVAPSGRAPVPAAVAVWSWPAQASLLAVLVAACALVVVPVAARLARRATVHHLRMEGGA